MNPPKAETKQLALQSEIHELRQSLADVQAKNVEKLKKQTQLQEELHAAEEHLQESQGERRERPPLPQGTAPSAKAPPPKGPPKRPPESKGPLPKEAPPNHAPQQPPPDHVVKHNLENIYQTAAEGLRQKLGNLTAESQRTQSELEKVG